MLSKLQKLFLEKLNELGEGCRELLRQSWKGIHLNEIAVKLNISYAYARKKKTECMAKLVMLPCGAISEGHSLVRRYGGSSSSDVLLARFTTSGETLDENHWRVIQQI